MTVKVDFRDANVLITGGMGFIGSNLARRLIGAGACVTLVDSLVPAYGGHLLYNNVYGIGAVALRLTNTYGPGMRVKDARQTFLGVWLRSLIDGAPIKVFGNGDQQRDFNFIDDVVDALMLAASHPEAFGQVYNLGSREVISLKQLA